MSKRRRSTRGNITRRGKDSWRVKFRVGTDPATGEEVQVLETVRGSVEDAERRLTQLLREHDVTGIVPDRRETIATFSRTWLVHVRHRVKPTTLKRYRELVNIHVVPAIGPVRLTEVRAAHVQQVVDRVLDVRSPRTAVNVYRVLSEMLGEAVRWGVLATNPAAGVRPPRAPRPKPNVPDLAACAAIRERVRGRQIEGPVVVGQGTGMRLGELLGLQNRNVDLDRKVLRVATTLSYIGGEYTFTAPKTSRARRSVDLPDYVVDFLRRHRREQNERKMALRDVWTDLDLVFDDGIGQPLSPWTVSADFRRVVHELGLPRTRFHDLRHAHATQLLSAGVHVKAVSERLGHSSTSFTMDVYSDVIPSMGRAAADAADQLFGEGGK
jgi:integrase